MTEVWIPASCHRFRCWSAEKCPKEVSVDLGIALSFSVCNESFGFSPSFLLSTVICLHVTKPLQQISRSFCALWSWPECKPGRFSDFCSSFRALKSYCLSALVYLGQRCCIQMGGSSILCKSFFRCRQGILEAGV